MFTTYQYKVDSTATNILADITLLLTGPGSDQVVDGELDDYAGSWVGGAGWSDGTTKANHLSDGIGTLTAATPLVAVIGRTYRVTFTMADYSIDGCTVGFGGATSANFTSNGVHTEDIVAVSSDGLVFTPIVTGSRFSVDVISVKPLSGITDKTLLSGDCVQAATEILSTVESGWEVYDNATGVSEQTVFRALNADGITYKYMMVDISDIGYVGIRVGESWDISTNVWTNLCYHSDQDLRESQVIDVTAGGTIFIGASITYAIFFSKNSDGTEYGSTTPGWGPCGCFERTRANGWDTVSTGYPCFFYANMNNIALSTAGWTGFYNAFAPRFKSEDGDVFNDDAFMSPVMEFSNTKETSFRTQIPRQRCWDDDGTTRKHYMHEIGFINNEKGVKYGKMLDIYFTTTAYGSAEDTISYLGNTYFIMSEFDATGAGTGARIAVPKY